VSVSVLEKKQHEKSNLNATNLRQESIGDHCESLSADADVVDIAQCD